MGNKAIRTEKALVAVKETIDTQSPMMLASGNEAVAAVADTLVKLTPSQRAFLRLRFYFETDAACANKLGIQPGTVRQWKHSDERFKGAYSGLLTQPLLHARAELALLTTKAIHALGELLESPNNATRLSAIEKVLKGRDAQLLTNSVKVEAGDGGDLYTQLLTKMAQRRDAEEAKPTTTEDVTDAEFHVVDVTPTTAPADSSDDHHDDPPS